MSKLKIKDIPHLDTATSDPVGGAKFGVRDEFYIGQDKFKAAVLLDFQADITADPKKGNFNVDYGYIYGTVLAIGKNSSVELGGGVSI